MLIVQEGESNQAALAAYAKSRGIDVTDVHCPVVYLSEREARL